MRKILYTTAHALEETDDGYDLGRSTSNNLSLAEILDDALVAELRRADLGYGTTVGNASLRAAIAEVKATRDNFIVQRVTVLWRRAWSLCG